LSANLGDRSCDRPHIDVGDFDTLVVFNLQRLVNDLRRSLDRETLLRRAALVLAEATHAAHQALVLSLVFGLCVILRLLAHREKVFPGSTGCIPDRSFHATGPFIEFDGREQLPLSEERVDLPNEFQGGILFVQDQRVDGVQHDRDLSAVEE